MSRLTRWFCLSLLIGATVAAAATPAGARPVWTPAFDTGALQIEIMKPAFESDPDLDALSSVSFFSFTVPLEANLRLVGDFSYSHVDPEHGSSSSTLGNPRLGIEYSRPEDDLAIELGVRLPLVDEDEYSAVFYALYADLSRWEAWVDEVVPAHVTVHVQSIGPAGIGFRFDGGPVFWLSTDDDVDTEVLAVYAAQIVYVGDDVRFGAGVSGRALISDDDFELDRSTMHEFGMSICFRAGTVWPGFTLRIPLDEDYSDIVEHVLEAQVSFELQ